MDHRIGLAPLAAAIGTLRHVADHDERKPADEAAIPDRGKGRPGRVRAREKETTGGGIAQIGGTTSRKASLPARVGVSDATAFSAGDAAESKA
jgi:hypothetical protein